jgi:hypothetical protein
MFPRSFEMLSFRECPKGTALALEMPLPNPNDIMAASSNEAGKIRILIGITLHAVFILKVMINV